MELPAFELQVLDAVVVKGQKRWIPDIKVIDGRKFLKVQKCDRGFCLFATGATMERRAGRTTNSTNLKCIDQLVELRRAACNEAFQRALRAAAESDAAPPVHRRKNPKVAVARETDHVIGGSIVQVQTPCGFCMSPLWSVQTLHVWVKFTRENLEWLRQAVLRDQSTEARGRTRSAKGRGRRRASEQPAPEPPALEGDESAKEGQPIAST